MPEENRGPWSKKFENPWFTDLPVFIVTTHLFYFTDRVSEKSNAIGRVCLSARLLPL